MTDKYAVCIYTKYLPTVLTQIQPFPSFITLLNFFFPFPNPFHHYTHTTMYIQPLILALSCLFAFSHARPTEASGTVPFVPGTKCIDSIDCALVRSFHHFSKLTLIMGLVRRRFRDLRPQRSCCVYGRHSWDLRVEEGNFVRR